MSRYICIDGLPTTATDEQLSSVLSAVAAVAWVKIIRDAAGKSLRFGLAELMSEADVAKAETALHGTRLGHHRLTVAAIEARILEALPQIAALLEKATAQLSGVHG